MELDSQQLDFRQGAARMSNRSVCRIHEDCEPSGNTAENSSAKSILFLDANVLFSAAYRENAGIGKFWKLSSVKLITSQYAFEEARRNLNQIQASRLVSLIKRVKIYTEYDNEAYIPQDISLRKKDRPILAVAIGAKANYLITGDFRDFGCLYGHCILGVTVLAPSVYLESYYKEASSIG